MCRGGSQEGLLGRRCFEALKDKKDFNEQDKGIIWEDRKRDPGNLFTHLFF